MNKSKQSYHRRSSGIGPNEVIDYKNINLLRRFVSERGKILPKRTNGLTSKQQRSVTVAIKRARVLASLPFPSSGS
uniref:Small ribosomal subunit protein bS18c n=2 Tax=Ophioglossum TaxID=13833 RepID=L7T1M4_9MONI|nr:ribosomal protein S18 [Ophioglossum californicum]AGC26734.1 ribosomal protein S18 [Ophioglossum californicum]QXF60107.1 ribosomal protein S18 [Ophioglossum vulgatum]